MTEITKIYEEYYWGVNPFLGLIYGQLQETSIKNYPLRVVLSPELSEGKSGIVRSVVHNKVFKTKEEAAEFALGYFQNRIDDLMKCVEINRDNMKKVREQII